MSQSSSHGAVTDWYQTFARPFLQEHDPPTVEAFDQELQRLARLDADRNQDLVICVLGNSGVGKSTLLNALVAGNRIILPQGGIGPLTAQATSVRYSEEPFFRATYLGRPKLSQLHFVLEQHHERSLRREGASLPAQAGRELGTPGSDSSVHEPPIEVEDSKGDPEEIDSHRIDALQRQACILIRGRQFGEFDLPYLLDGLRVALGRSPRWGTTLAEDDRTRVADIQKVLLGDYSEDRPHEERAGNDLPGFLEKLRWHAAGFLSPLIRTLEVGWNAPTLRNGLVVVDLPGLGVANDEYRSVTNQWIRSARAVILVVDRSGLNESSAELLRTTGFLNSLLHESHDPAATPVSLMLSVVKLDLVADDERRIEKERQPPPHRKWIEHFEDACAQARELLRAQLKEELQRIWGKGVEGTREEREAVLRRVLDGTEIHPVSALEFRRLEENDDDERPRISAPEQSGIPGLGSALERIASNHAMRLAAHLLQRRSMFVDQVELSLATVRARWEQQTRAEAEAEKLKEDLDEVVKPKRDELTRRQSAFREFLRQSLPDLVSARLDLAAKTANEAIDGFLASLRGCHWATLRATIRRGGKFVGARHVDLPNEFALLFEEPVAVVWSKDILASLRKRTRELADDYLQITEEIVTWTRGQGTRVDPRLVEAVQSQIKGELKALASVGADAISELREKVKFLLFERLEREIRARCERFVEERRDIGPGVKARIIEFLSEELVPLVIEAGRHISQGILIQNFEAVRAEITEAFAYVQDPIVRLEEEIVSRESARIRRSDAQRKRQVLASLDAIVAARPPNPATALPGPASA